MAGIRDDSGLFGLWSNMADDSGAPAVRWRKPDGTLADVAYKDETGLLYNANGDRVGHTSRWENDYNNSLPLFGEGGVLNALSPFHPNVTQYGQPSLRVPPILSGTASVLGDIVGGLSPIHPDAGRAGAPSYQVPPMLKVLGDSAWRLTQNSGVVSGDPDIDFQNQQDMSNVLLSLYGGNAMAGLRRGAPSSVALHSPERTSFDLNFGPDDLSRSEFLNGSEIRYGGSHLGDGSVYIKKLSTPESEAGRGQARSLMEQIVAKADQSGTPLSLDAQAWEPRTDVAKVRDFYRGLGFDPVDGSGMMRREPRLFSDTGKPSLLGSALATAGEQRAKPVLSGGPGEFVPSGTSRLSLAANQAADHALNLGNIPSHFSDMRMSGLSPMEAASDTIDTLLASKSALNSEYAHKRRALDAGGHTPFDYTITTPDGDFMGSARGTVAGDTMFLDWLGGHAPNSIGVSGVRSLREQIRSDFPDVKNFEGIRVSGAKDKASATDRLQSVTLKSDVFGVPQSQQDEFDLNELLTRYGAY